MEFGFLFSPKCSKKIWMVILVLSQQLLMVVCSDSFIFTYLSTVESPSLFLIPESLVSGSCEKYQTSAFEKISSNIKLKNLKNPALTLFKNHKQILLI